MRDPTGDLPWEEDPSGAEVYHVADPTVRFILLTLTLKIYYKLCHMILGPYKTIEERNQTDYDHVLCSMVWLL